MCDAVIIHENFSLIIIQPAEFCLTLIAALRQCIYLFTLQKIIVENSQNMGAIFHLYDNEILPHILIFIIKIEKHAMEELCWLNQSISAKTIFCSNINTPPRRVKICLVHNPVTVKEFTNIRSFHFYVASNLMMMLSFSVISMSLTLTGLHYC